MGAHHRGTVADGDVGQGGVGTDDTATADLGAAQQLGTRVNDGVAADGDVDVDPGGSRVDDGDAGQLVSGHHPPVEFGGQLGQLDAIVDAGHQRAVVDVAGMYGLAVGAQDGDDVGEVELLLGVVGAQPAQCGPQRGDVEGVDAGVDFADFPLRWCRVGLLHDRHDFVILGAQDAAVAEGIIQRRGQHRHRSRHRAVGGDQVGQRVGVQQRGISRGDHDVAGVVIGQRGQPAEYRMPGP
ncbi:Uncharacterised protein [Mycobacterium tuberculosis]|uniref:Uncharacterized protein n=2 Tax=Mycobacterium tuberculosis TaxID=1773 RepID=A0A655E9Y0_MYCTX|nr:Uncharacterised protein [Mycobacterium tuberculosis]CKR87166.1 Uncharacterised protein [Mycobacterium tuberculosis]CNV12079.1 Uncharacterised protein [Mycobacterium tuberculosis]